MAVRCCTGRIPLGTMKYESFIGGMNGKSAPSSWKTSGEVNYTNRTENLQADPENLKGGHKPQKRPRNMKGVGVQINKINNK